MDELIKELERKIYSLIKNYEGLQSKTHSLGLRKLQLSRDHEQLLIKHKGAIIQIEGMVARLKSIEGLS